MTPSLIAHGGAGAATPPELQVDRRAGLRAAFDTGWKVLLQGGPAIDAVVQATVGFEGHPLFNAGLGSCLTEDGTVEVDASLMDGSTFQTGAIGAVKNVKNAIRLAQAVMKEGRNVFLVGEGAERFARKKGFPKVEGEELITERQYQRWQTQRTKGEAGTVGAVALDSSGNLAAATSTGGVFNKQSGRGGGFCRYWSWDLRGQHYRCVFGHRRRRSDYSSDTCPHSCGINARRKGADASGENCT